LESRVFPGVAFSQISPYGTRVDRRVITWIADSIGTMAAFDTQKFAGLHKLATRLGTDHLPRPAATNYTIGPAWAAHGELVIHFFRSIGLTIIRDQLGSGFPLFPSQGERPSTLNHGDRNRDNVLIHPDEGVAMIDWELAFLGDVALEIALTKRRFQLTPEDMELLFADIEERQPHVLGVGHERPWVRQKLMKHLRRSVTRYEEVDLAKSITVDLIRFPKRIAKLRMGPEPKGRQLLAQLSPSTTSDIKAILNLLDTEAPSDLEHRVQAHLWRQSTFVLRNMKDSYTMRATPEMALAS
jgi:hypothetical protein